MIVKNYQDTEYFYGESMDVLHTEDGRYSTVLDKNGNPFMFYNKREPIGFKLGDKNE